MHSYFLLTSPKTKRLHDDVMCSSSCSPTDSFRTFDLLIRYISSMERAERIGAAVIFYRGGAARRSSG